MKKVQENKGNVNHTIKYNNKVMDDKNTEITVNSFSENETDNVAVFILKYNLEEDGQSIPYEAVLGKIELKNSIENLASKSKIVRDYLSEQLKQNNKGINNYEYCKKLSTICRKHRIPFIYTDEGIKIVTNDSKNTEVIEKTYNIQEKNALMELRCLNPYSKMNLLESEIKLIQNLQEKIVSHNILSAAGKELKSKEERIKVARGKALYDFKTETNKEVIMDKRREKIIEYLLFDYNKNQGKKKNTQEQRASLEDYLKLTQYLKTQNSDKRLPHSLVIGEEEEQTDAEKYFRLKEKGIAIDIRKMLEDSQNEALEKQIDNAENIEDIEEQNSKDNYINNCKTIFDFIKQGRDVNTQFFYKMKKDDFRLLYSIVDEQKDKTDRFGNKVYNVEEIMQYLKMKEEIIKNIKLDKKKSFLDFELYEQNSIIQEFMQFVMKSEVRKDTRKEEQDMLLEMYQSMVDEMIKNSQEDVELYNTYAERFKSNVCPIPEDIQRENQVQNGFWLLEDIDNNGVLGDDEEDLGEK